MGTCRCCRLVCGHHRPACRPCVAGAAVRAKPPTPPPVQVNGDLEAAEPLQATRVTTSCAGEEAVARLLQPERPRGLDRTATEAARHSSNQDELVAGVHRLHPPREGRYYWIDGDPCMAGELGTTVWLRAWRSGDGALVQLEAARAEGRDAARAVREDLEARCALEALEALEALGEPEESPVRPLSLALSRREGHVEVAEWLVQLTYRPRDEGPRADPRRLTDVHGTGQAHTAHLDRKSGLLNSAPPPRAVAPDPRATHEGVERFLHQVVVLPRGVLGH